MMTQQFNTKLKGKLVLTDSYHADKTLQKEKSLYKFIWVRSGSITLEIDHQEIMLAKNEIISLSNLQHLEFKSIDGDYLTLLFNSNFYCIYGNDHEVSCSGFLFNGSSHVIRFTLNEAEQKTLNDIADTLCKEFSVTDNLQEEMLRIQLKRFIIQSTRIARHRLNITQEKEYSFEIIRQFFIFPHKSPGVLLDPFLDALVFCFFTLRFYFFKPLLGLSEFRVIAFCDLFFPLLHRLTDGFCNRTLFSLKGTL